MAKVERFEDLKCWQSAIELATDVYSVCQSLKDFNYINQITRASISISNNIAEGLRENQIKTLFGFFQLPKHQVESLDLCFI